MSLSVSFPDPLNYSTLTQSLMARDLSTIHKETKAQGDIKKHKEKRMGKKKNEDKRERERDRERERGREGWFWGKDSLKLQSFGVLTEYSCDCHIRFSAAVPYTSSHFKRLHSKPTCCIYSKWPYPVMCEFCPSVHFLPPSTEIQAPDMTSSKHRGMPCVCVNASIEERGF